MLSRLRAVWGARRVLALLVARDLRLKYTTSSLGWVWTVLEPLLMATTFWFIFTKIVPRGLGLEPYIVFLLIAYLPFQWIQSVIGRSPRALQSQSKLVRSTAIPREIWVLRLVGATFAEMVLALPVLLVFMLVHGEGVSAYVLVLPVAFVMLFVLLSGIALGLAAVGVLYRDVRQLTGVVNRLLFYLSPIIYGVTDVSTRLPDAVATVYMLNPVAGYVDVFRAAVFPEAYYGWWPFAWASLVSVAAFVLGARTFARLERSVLKEI